MNAANGRRPDIATATPAPLAVSSLANGHATPILVADFEPFSAMPRLSEQLCADARNHPIYRIDPHGDLARLGAYRPIAGLAAEYAAAFADTRPADGELFVIGYCGAATLALNTAELLAGRQAVTTILVRPTWPDTALVERQFAEFQAELGGAPQRGPDLDGDPSRAIAEMERVLSADVTALAASRGINRTHPALTELLTRYRAWLAFLLTTRNGLPLPSAPRGRVVILTGTTTPGTVPWASASPCEIERIPSLEAGPLVSPEVADAVLTLTAGART